MIIVPIAIAWFQIHVSSASTNGVPSNFQTINEVHLFATFSFTLYSILHQFFFIPIILHNEKIQFLL